LILMSRCEKGGGSVHPPVMGAQEGYFSYTDATGVEVIVGSLTDVPEPQRAEAKHIDLSKPAIRAPSGEPGRTDGPMPRLCLGDVPGCLHTASFLIGAAVAVVLGGVGMLAFRKAARLVAGVAGVFAIGALVTAYLTHARRLAGLPGDKLATPAVLIDDARAAAKAAEEHQRKQARALDELDRQR
jgi:hypothetical protein